DRGVRRGDADEERHGVDEHRGEDEVHERAGHEYDGALPRGVAVESARLIARVDLLERGHPDDLDEATGGDRLDAVLGLAATDGPQGGTEADEELARLHAVM